MKIGLGRFLDALGLSLIILLSVNHGSCAAEKRVALVIGNSAYQHVQTLINPSNDAAQVARTLRNAGFSLVTGKPVLNANRSRMERAIREFGRQINSETVSLFYFAGHGFQLDGENYLVPVEASVEREVDAKYETVNAGFLLDQLAYSGGRLNIVILDACRNNPFRDRGFRSVQRGLAQVSAPSGTLIAYATEPGQVAMDGRGANSPYTAALVETLGQPGLDLYQVFNAIGLKVMTSTGNQQKPWFASSPMTASFYFMPPRADEPPPVVAWAPNAPTPSAGWAPPATTWSPGKSSEPVTAWAPSEPPATSYNAYRTGEAERRAAQDAFDAIAPTLFMYAPDGTKVSLLSAGDRILSSTTIGSALAGSQATTLSPSNFRRVVNDLAAAFMSRIESSATLLIEIGEHSAKIELGSVSGRFTED